MNKLTGFIVLSLLIHGMVLIHAQSNIANVHKAVGSPVLNISLSIKKNSTEKNTSVALPEPADLAKTNTEPVTRNTRLQHSVQSPAVIASNLERSTQLALQQTELASNSKKPSFTNTGSKQTTTSTTVVNHNEANTRSSVITADEFRETHTKSQKEAQRNYLLGEIHSQLSKYMAYPYRARARGWEGSVLIGFNIDRRGFLRNIHLSRTSGYSLLDNAALTAVRKVSSIPLNEWGSTFQPIALQLPVVYRLTSG